MMSSERRTTSRRSSQSWRISTSQRTISIAFILQFSTRIRVHQRTWSLTRCTKTTSKSSGKMPISSRNRNQLQRHLRELKDSQLPFKRSTLCRCSRPLIIKRWCALLKQRMEIANRRVTASIKLSRPTWTVRAKELPERSTIRQWPKFQGSTTRAAKLKSSH